MSTADHRGNNFDLLRLLLAAAVIFAHCPEITDGDKHREPLTAAFGTITLADLAVDGFFILSGYLILQSWDRSPRLASFGRKRALRIVPGFVVASLLSALVVGPLGSDPATYFAGFNPVAYLRSMALFEPPEVPPVFAGQPWPAVNGPLWTIGYEVRCYLLVAALGCTGLARRWVWLPLTLAVVAVSVIPGLDARVYFPGSWLVLGSPVAFFRLVALFGAGGCFYLLRGVIPLTRWGAILAAVGLVAGLAGTKETAQIAPCTAGAYLLLWAAFHTRPVRLKHDISYGLYLYGWPVQKLIAWYVPGISPWALVVPSLAGAALCGWASWRLVERPFLRLK
ncbi:MAG TPA: acyltransferase [Urbifossiella sp.]|jgi:peptidoglycan/LPS O-acetylase OafA/YrhL|nr:acyltransferase [Urbifossiella sp.]